MKEYIYDTVIEEINNKPVSDRTVEKERFGERAIKENHLWDILFPNNLGYKKITDKRSQKLGIDYKIFTSDAETSNVDIKVCIGSDYTEGLPIEVYQRPVREPDIPSSYTFTNRSSKLTDFLVYLVLDKSGFRVYKIPYNVVHDICVKYKWQTVELMTNRGLCYKIEKHPDLMKSFNGTGYYVKVMFEDYRIV